MKPDERQRKELLGLPPPLTYFALAYKFILDDLRTSK